MYNRYITYFQLIVDPNIMSNHKSARLRWFYRSLWCHLLYSRPIVPAAQRHFSFVFTIIAYVFMIDAKKVSTQFWNNSCPLAVFYCFTHKITLTSLHYNGMIYIHTPSLCSLVWYYYILGFVYSISLSICVIWMSCVALPDCFFFLIYFQLKWVTQTMPIE